MEDIFSRRKQIMFNRFITNRVFIIQVLQAVGGALFLVALLFSFRVAMEPVREISPTGTDVRSLIEISFTDTFLHIAHQNILLLGAAGVLLFGLSSRRIFIAYWSLQLAVWLTGISLWYGTAFVLNPFPESPVWLITTIVCSLVLLILYKPLISLLQKLIVLEREGLAS